MNRHQRTTTAAGIVAGCLLALGCQAPGPPHLDGPIITEVMTASEVSANLRELAMPGGRLSGSENGAKGEAYVHAKLTEYGLVNVRYEPFDMVTWRDRKTLVTVLDDPPWTLNVVQALGGTLSTPSEGITAELVDVGKGTEADFEANSERVPGKFVLAHYGGPRRQAKMKETLRHGGAGLFHISRLDDLVIVGSCHEEPSQVPGLGISKNDGSVLADRLAAGETVRVNVKVEANVWSATPRNVVGEIRGTGPTADEVVILCAHLDSWHLAEGAIDNGTGSAVVLEAARALAKLGPAPRRTIRFVWFMGEEHGLFGSKAYVAAHVDELDKIVAVVNLDMPGEPRQLVTFGHPEIAPLLDSVCTALPGYEMSSDASDSTRSWSDHAPFMKQGVCTMTISGDLGPGAKYYHTTGDTYDEVDRPGLSGCAAVAAVLARRLADADPLPARRLDPADFQEEPAHQ